MVGISQRRFRGTGDGCRLELNSLAPTNGSKCRLHPGSEIGIGFNAAKAYREEHGEDGRPKVADGAVVGFFSLEMSAEQLSTRMLSSASKLNSAKIINGRISPEEFSHLVRVSNDMSQMPFFV